MTNKTNIYISVNLLIAVILILGIALSLIPSVFITSTKIVPDFFGSTLVKVDSAAMQPDFNRNQIVVIENVETEEIKIDDKIAYYTFNEQGDLTGIVFRVVVDCYENDSGERLFATKGIANANAEERLVHQSAVIGKYNEDAKFVKGLFAFTASTGGIIVLVIIPTILSVAAQFMLSLHFKRKLTAKENNAKIINMRKKNNEKEVYF